MDEREPIVITGIGMIASVGQDRESVWQAVQAGKSGVHALVGVQGIEDGTLIGAPVDLEAEYLGQLKPIALCQRAAEEALADATIDWTDVDRDRFGCAISGHMGDTNWIASLSERYDLVLPHVVPWWHQWMPNTACWLVANRYGLNGPRMCHSTACASGLIDILAAVRAIRDEQCDIALAGSAEGLHPLFAAGFRQMRVLAQHEDPTQACRPFDIDRCGFVMGEGSAMFVLERLSHAQRRGAKIYAQLVSGKMLAEAHHVTGLDEESAALAYLINATLRDARLSPADIAYINAHGTGTQQNDLVETRGIRRAFGASADATCVSATKSMLGHLVNAAGSVELAITTLALRDGYVPPTINLDHPDPACDLDCVPLVGRRLEFEHALKVSVAFGGHLAAATIRRWDGPDGVPSRGGQRAA
jgi:3-oxoacyl-(acyl-carrier-protein) synthase